MSGLQMNKLEEVFINAEYADITSKFKVEVAKLEMPAFESTQEISWLLYMQLQATQFQQLQLCFWGPASQ